MTTIESRSAGERLQRDYAKLPDLDRVQRTAAALEQHGMTVRRARSANQAKRIVLDLLPEGAQVHQGTRRRSKPPGSAGRSRPPDVTTQCDPACGAWTARPRATRSVG
jgi:hypothetical protein